MATITPEQLAQLQGLVTTLTTHKADEDAKTATSNQKDAALATATSDANQAKLDEQAAQATVATDLQNLRTFIDGLS